MLEGSSMVGGVARRVQVDETAIARGRLITDLSNAHDESTNVVWLLRKSKRMVKEMFS